MTYVFHVYSPLYDGYDFFTSDLEAALHKYAELKEADLRPHLHLEIYQDADDVDPEIEDCLMSECRDLPDDNE